MVTYKLTGRTRNRAQNRFMKVPLIVVQVEVHAKGYVVEDARGNGHDLDSMHWRDARVEDLQDLFELAQQAQSGLPTLLP